MRNVEFIVIISKNFMKKLALQQILNQIHNY